MKNTQNIMLKNILDACVGALGFWATGYGFAYGARADRKPNWFIGNDLFFLSNGFEGKDAFHSWFFQFAFAATAATIVSGAVAERCSMTAYAGYSLFLTMFVYPVVAHWIWSSDGWLSAFIHDPMLDVGVIDFAGCGVVHMVGGVAAGVGAWILGPRIGRFGPDAVPLKGHSMPLVVLGTFLLWVGWYGFNPGSTLAIAGDGVAHVASKTAVTTTLSAAGGGLTNLFIHYKLTFDPSVGHGTFDVAEMCNGVLAGLVGITSACSVVEPWAAVVIGAIGAVFYTIGCKVMVKLQIDDAVCATPVHYFAGSWGLFAPAFFARPENMRNAYGIENRAGLFYGGGGHMLAMQALAFVVVTLWVALCMIPFFSLMNALDIFRVDEADELLGLDDSKHGGSAYDSGFTKATEEDVKVKLNSELVHADDNA